VKKNLTIYIPAIIVVLVVKMYYRTADSEQLFWILAPTTEWVQILSGISFEKITQVGYVSHEHRFIIAPSCSGVRFLLIAFIMMVFTFVPMIDSLRKKACWLGFSAIFSYITTIFVNGIRITVSIYLPLALVDKEILPAWITAEQLHTMIGTTVYFSMLFGIYYLAGRLCKLFLCTRTRKGNMQRKLPASGAQVEEENFPTQLYVETAQKSTAKRFLIPVFWYFAMVLGIPAIGRWYRSDWTGFLQYTVLVTGVCMLIVLFIWLAGRMRTLFADWLLTFKSRECVKVKFLRAKE
jgi:exosortase K